MVAKETNTASAKYPAPGTKGSMMLGQEIDEPIEGLVARFNAKGAKITAPIVNDSVGRFVHFEDPDGNEICFWEVNRAEVLESEFAQAGTQTRG